MISIFCSFESKAEELTQKRQIEVRCPWSRTSRWENKYEHNFFSREIGSRAIYAIQTPISLVAAVSDLALGILAAAASLALLGQCHKLNKFAATELSCGGCLLSKPFYNLVKVINPHAEKPCPINCKDGFRSGFRSLTMMDSGWHLKTRFLAPVYLTGVALGAVIDIALPILVAPFTGLKTNKASESPSYLIPQTLVDLSIDVLSTPVIVYDIYRTALFVLNPVSAKNL